MPIDKPYAYHHPSADGLKRITRLRQAFSEVDRMIRLECPDSRQRAVALTYNETTAMWAIKAVVFNDPESVITLADAEPEQLSLPFEDPER